MDNHTRTITINLTICGLRVVLDEPFSAKFNDGEVQQRQSIDPKAILYHNYRLMKG